MFCYLMNILLHVVVGLLALHMDPLHSLSAESCMPHPSCLGGDRAKHGGNNWVDKRNSRFVKD